MRLCSAACSTISCGDGLSYAPSSHCRVAISNPSASSGRTLIPLGSTLLLPSAEAANRTAAIVVGQSAKSANRRKLYFFRRPCCCLYSSEASGCFLAALSTGRLMSPIWKFGSVWHPINRGDIRRHAISQPRPPMLVLHCTAHRKLIVLHYWTLPYCRFVISVNLKEFSAEFAHLVNLGHDPDRMCLSRVKRGSRHR